jgi:gamma-D-glutamyl-L-lysine dipeptidyl-peptidase
VRAVRVSAVRAEPSAGAERVTQLLAGELVEVRAREGDWLSVVAPSQWSALDPVGHPGWVRADDLAFDDESVVAIARTFLGVPYSAGGLTHDGVDAAGLVHAVHRLVGVAVPRAAADQAARCEPVAIGNERPGDLWFLAADGPGTPVTHVGFWTATGTLLHVPGPGQVVVEEPVAEDLRATLVSAGRF